VKDSVGLRPVAAAFAAYWVERSTTVARCALPPEHKYAAMAEECAQAVAPQERNALEVCKPARAWERNGAL
jgi:hypothetical protein